MNDMLRQIIGLFENYTNDELQNFRFSLEILLSKKRIKNLHHAIRLKAPNGSNVVIIGERHMKNDDEYKWCKKYFDQNNFV